MSRVRKLPGVLKNPYLVSVLTKVFSVLVGVLYIVFQARFLGAEIKGQIATVNSMVGITSIVFEMGIYQAYPYFKRNSKTDILPIFMKIALLLLGFYMAIALIAIAALDLPLKYGAVMIITPLLVYDGIVSYITLVEEPNKCNFTNALVMVGELILVIMLWLFATPTFFLGVLILVVKDVTKALIFTFWWRKRIFVETESIRLWLLKLAKFGFFPMLSLLMATLNYRIDVLMLDNWVADAAIGVYSVGVTVAERVWMIPDAMKGVMVSNLAKGKGAEETSYVIRVCNTVCLCLIIGIILLGKPFINLAFGAEYAGSYRITVMILIGVFSMVFYKTIAAFNIAMGRQMVSFILLGISVFSNVVVNLLLIPRMGIYGAAIATIVSYSFCAIMFIVYFCRTTGQHIKDMLFVKGDDIGKLKAMIRRKRNK